MSLSTDRVGQVAPGIRAIRYEGSTYHSLPSPLGLIVELSSSELLLIDYEGVEKKIAVNPGGWLPREAGIATQSGGKYYFTPYDEKPILLHVNSTHEYMRCSETGIVLRECGGLTHILFDGSGKEKFWAGPYITSLVVDNGVVLYKGDRQDGEWGFVDFGGTYRTILKQTNSPFNSGIGCSGYVWSVDERGALLHHWDLPEPAITKYAYLGGCCQGILANFNHQIVLYRFGGEEISLWQGGYRRWHGSSDVGLFIVKDDQVLLLPYDGSSPIALWEGPFEALRPFNNALIVKNGREVVMIPLPQ